jgi:hypothetical protein
MLVKKCKNQTFITAVNFLAVITVPGENFSHKNRPLQGFDFVVYFWRLTNYKLTIKEMLRLSIINVVPLYLDLLWIQEAGFFSFLHVIWIQVAAFFVVSEEVETTRLHRYLSTTANHIVAAERCLVQDFAILGIIVGAAKEATIYLPLVASGFAFAFSNFVAGRSVGFEVLPLKFIVGLH